MLDDAPPMHMPPSRRLAARTTQLGTAERARRRIVSLVMLVYLLLIFEGALRKWLLPSFGQLLFFIRDPFVLWIYWLAARNGFIPRGQPLLIAGIAFGVTTVFWLGLQAAGPASGVPQWPLLAAYGWRNYFLYIPLPFIISLTFLRQDLHRLIKVSLALAIPIALLVLLQFRAAPDAPINVGFGGLSQQFRGLGIDENHTRPMGTFTSDVGQKQFVVSCVAMLLSLWIAPKARRFLKPWQLMAATFAVLSCLAVSGSRGSVLASGVVTFAAVGSSAVLRGKGGSMRAFLLPLIIVAAAVLLYPIVFPDGYAAFMGRWNIAAEVESQSYHYGLVGRTFLSLIDFVYLLGETPLVGYGLGFAGNATAVLGITIPGLNSWAESDWARHIVDLGPLLGIAFMVYRITLVFWLMKMAWIGARRSGDPLPLLLLAYFALDLMYGQVTGHGTINGYVWIFSGLCLAACRTSDARESASVARPGGVPGGAPGGVPRRAAPLFANLMR